MTDDQPYIAETTDPVTGEKVVRTGATAEEAEASINAYLDEAYPDPEDDQ